MAQPLIRRSLTVAALALTTGLLAACDVHVYGTTTPDVVVVGSEGPYGSYDGYSGSTGYGRTPNRRAEPTYTYGQGTRNPVIQSFTANPTNVVPAGQPITFQVVAYDPERSVLQYNWSATGGTLSSNAGQAISWQPPAKAGIYTVMVTIANRSGGFVMGSLNLTVLADGSSVVGNAAASPTPAPTATPSPSPTAAPTATPSPSPSPSATPTPAPSASPTPTPSPSATPTPSPSAS